VSTEAQPALVAAHYYWYVMLSWQLRKLGIQKNSPIQSLTLTLDQTKTETLHFSRLWTRHMAIKAKVMSASLQNGGSDPQISHSCGETEQQKS